MTTHQDYQIEKALLRKAARILRSTAKVPGYPDCSPAVQAQSRRRALAVLNQAPSLSRAPEGR